jgi:seryl-tRNA synthetase
MWPREEVVRVLRARGELWNVAPGVTALRGDAAALLRSLERAIVALCELETCDEWRVPPAIDFATLARSDYFASFPQWLTLASHLSDDESSLQQVADLGEKAAGSADVLRGASTAPKLALNPAVCYHVYSALSGAVIKSPRLVTAQSQCWRHEGARHATLDRAWAFTMREVVCLGAADDARAFVERCTDRVVDLARALDLDATIDVATDPFFAPAARAKHLLQRLKELKRELLLPIGPQGRTAASSFNLHDTFFGEAFDIRLVSGEPATTACVAFGLERWLLAFLARHGPHAVAWPAIDALAEVRHG